MRCIVNFNIYKYTGRVFVTELLNSWIYFIQGLALGGLLKFSNQSGKEGFVDHRILQGLSDHRILQFLIFDQKIIIITHW